MKRLRTDAGRLKMLGVSPLYTVSGCVFKLCFLNTRSLHRHIDDVRKDLNYSNTDLNLFSETRFSHLDNEDMYKINGYQFYLEMTASLPQLIADPMEEQLSIAKGIQTVKILMAWK